MRILFCLFILLCTPIIANAQERVLDIQEVVSASGIKAWLIEDESLPIISLEFSFKGAGSINESLDQQGVSKLLSNMLDEGAGDLDSQAFQKALSDHSISLSFSGSRDHFGGQVKTLSRHKDKAFNLLSMALSSPRFDSKPLERMKKSNISRIKSSLTDPDWIAARLQNDLIYKGHPYAQNSGGTISTLELISADDLRAYKDKYLTRNRLIVSAAGDIDAKELALILDQIFQSIPENELSHKEVPFKPQTGTYLYSKDIPQTIIEISYPAFDRNDPDYYAAQVFNYIFGGGGFGSRLMEEVREKQGLTYGIYSGFSFLDQAQNLSISTSTQNDKVDDVLKIINQEIEKIQNTPVGGDELQNAKDYLIGSVPLTLTSTDKISGTALGMLSNARPIDYLDTYGDKIGAITSEDIQRVARRILIKENQTIVFVGQPQSAIKTNAITEIPNVQ